MKISKERKKAVNINIDRELWVFLKKLSIDQDRPMIDIISELILKYKKRCENRLTTEDKEI